MVKNNENAIREAAYYNWQNAGCPNGQDEYFWAMAVEQFSNCKSNTCTKASSKKTVSKSSTSCKTKSAACKSTTSSKKSK